MPEYPDITVYMEHLEHLARDQKLQKIRIISPFFLRSFDPPVSALNGLILAGVERIGKRVIFVFENDYFLIVHLMIAGRFYWKKKDAAVPRKNGLAALDFENGSLVIMEHSSKKRASLHLVKGRDSLDKLNPGGLDIFHISIEEFAGRLRSENHTLKRSLTTPRLFSGIGNAYSDEILHRARMSPFLMTGKMDDDQISVLFEASKSVLTEWTSRLREEWKNKFPDKVTAFHKDMAVHGRFKEPCPICGTTVQRIQYGDHETNYCPVCQTGGKILADRALSRLLKEDWPRTVEEWEAKSGNS